MNIWRGGKSEGLISIFNWNVVRDRPFNLKGGGGGGVMVFCSVQKFFFGQHKS